VQRTKIVIAPDVLFQELDDEVVLLNLNNEHYYGLDDVGTRLWQLLLEHGDPESAVTRMLAEYEVDEASLRNDVEILIAELERAGLVVVERAP
jgi:hypothetical protein